MTKTYQLLTLLVGVVMTQSCQTKNQEDSTDSNAQIEQVDSSKSELQPLITELYTADPSAHVFNDVLYIYPSHDFESGIPEDDLGSHFDMKDYHVFSMDNVGGAIKDHGEVLSVEDVAWADKQMWAPDAAKKGDKYYLYFPAKDPEGIFKIGVATSDYPYGPFTAEKEPIKGSFSIDPAVFEDSDNSYYMYFGGIWGGQLQRWSNGEYTGQDTYPADSLPAVSPKVAKLSEDMLSFEEEPKDIVILGEDGEPITVGENEKRFFEAAWVHKYNDRYYFSYSTGDTHNIAYAIGESPYGPFTYQGVILKPVLGWTNHHSIVEHNGKWWLFFHDSSLSGGKTHLRSVKVTELKYNSDGTIQTIDALVEPL
ncbi:glycoside hydrolase family 43 protein [Fulvivirga lutimaris]|uniref:glycoside hydrolase family 43 protein n=1 Tax=Fulvivirga lutimaris TaxID=1819566 RepID=UPI0012BBFA79|nr:glycoside hydrolase family 43 protein [Fulvivirga lutimaris]MTI40595.1 alpha-N-arabinofuranosidase [Fulvivirga lutimaris]